VCDELVRGGNDLVLVAELAGHRRLETTRRYSLPSAADRQAAMDAIEIEGLMPVQILSDAEREAWSRFPERTRRTRWGRSSR